MLDARSSASASPSTAKLRARIEAAIKGQGVGHRDRSSRSRRLRTFAVFEAAGVDQTVLCSDLGQVGIFSPIEGFRRGIKPCMDLGFDDGQIRKMVSSNAARMLGIEADLPSA